MVHADRDGEKFQALVNRATEADALHAAGAREKAQRLFAEADRRQQELMPRNPLLYSIKGFQYCDLLISRGRASAARDRAARTLEWARARNLVFDIALDNVTLGRAHLALALENLASRALAASASADARIAGGKLDEATKGFRNSGRNDHLPRCLLARATFRRTVGDWSEVARDLDDAQEIADPGPMRLYLCDIALGRARLALTRREAFAPLNGLVSQVRRLPLRPTPPRRPRSGRRRAPNSTGRASSSPSAATIGATRNSPSSAQSSPAPAASQISRRASEAHIGHRLQCGRRSDQSPAQDLRKRSLSNRAT